MNADILREKEMAAAKMADTTGIPIEDEALDKVTGGMAQSYLPPRTPDFDLPPLPPLPPVNGKNGAVSLSAGVSQ